MVRTCLLLGLVLFSTGCSKDREDPMDEPLAQVGDLTITQREFVYRTQFFPPPDIESVNGLSRKESLLELLIAEKLMALAARKARLDTNLSYREMVQYATQQAALKAFYDDMIDRNIRVTDKEIEEVLRKKQKRFLVQVFATYKKETAETFRKQVLEGGNFEQLMNTYYGQELKPEDYTREVTWGEWIDALEAPLYMMREGDLSPVLKTPKGYVVMRLVRIRQLSPTYSEQDMQRLRQKVAKTLRSRKADTLTGKFIETFMNQKQVVVKGEVFGALARWLDKVLDYKTQSAASPVAASNQEVDFDSLRTVFEERLHEPLVTFQGGHFTLKDMLTKMRVRRLDFNTRSPLTMRQQLLSDIKMIVRDELIAREAIRRGFHEVPRARREIAMWRQYYLSRLFASRTGLTPKFQKKVTLPDTLMALRRSTPIWINRTMLDTLYVSPYPMFAVQPGRVTHLVVPPWPVF